MVISLPNFLYSKIKPFKTQSDLLKKINDVTLCHTMYAIAIEARSAVAAVSAGVVPAVSKLGALISIVRT